VLRSFAAQSLQCIIDWKLSGKPIAAKPWAIERKTEIFHRYVLAPSYICGVHDQREPCQTRIAGL
jgi:hypothetical protein